MSAETQRDGILFVVSAPSGTGKTTLARRLVEELDGLSFSVSYTTRPVREGEQDGIQYHFLDSAEFERMRAAGEFLESAEVFEHLYGTGVAETRKTLASGADLVLEIDVQGACQVRQGPIPAVSVMILPPDFATLEKRLQGRGSEEPEIRAGRLAQARREAMVYAEFDYLVINDELGRALAELRSIVQAKRRRTGHCRAEAVRILDTFPAGA